jgi:hypothetical protein
MEIIIEPGSFMHGIFPSDIDRLLIYHYLELEIEFARIVEESQSDDTMAFIDLFINQLKTKIADNDRIIRNLEIEVANENVKQGFVSANLIRLNKLKSVNDKSECLIEYLELLKDKPLKTNAERFKEQLNKYGFFELQKVQRLSEEGKRKLIDLICSNGLPYCIAMFSHLDFVRHLKEYFNSGKKLNNELSKWFNSDSRTIKGNISVLAEYSKENKTRYTAFLHKDTVQKDYQKLQ